MKFGNRIKIMQRSLTYYLSQAISQGFEEEKDYIFFETKNQKGKRYTVKIAKSPEVLETNMLKQRYNRIYIPSDIMKVIDILLDDEFYHDDEIIIKKKYIMDTIGLSKKQKYRNRINNYITIIKNIKIEFIDHKDRTKKTNIIKILEEKTQSIKYQICNDFKEMTKYYLLMDKIAFTKPYYSTYRAILYNKFVNNNKRDNREISVKQLIENHQALDYEDMKDNNNWNFTRDIQKPITKALEDIQQDNILFSAFYYNDEEPPPGDESKLYIPEKKDINKKEPPFKEWKLQKILFIYK